MSPTHTTVRDTDTDLPAGYVKYYVGLARIYIFYKYTRARMCIYICMYLTRNKNENVTVKIITYQYTVTVSDLLFIS